jgi:hypothetical protein
MKKIRAANLRLLRNAVFDTDQITFSEIINIHQSKYSEYEREKKTLPDWDSSRIDSMFELPSGWMDRDNTSIFLSQFEYDLVNNIRGLTVEQQKEFKNVIGGIINMVSSKSSESSKLTLKVGVSSNDIPSTTEEEISLRKRLAQEAPKTNPRREDYPNQIVYLRDKIRYAQLMKNAISL